MHGRGQGATLLCMWGACAMRVKSRRTSTCCLAEGARLWSLGTTDWWARVPLLGVGKWRSSHL